MLGRWHGWGAAPQLFDRAEYAEDRQKLENLLGPADYQSASRTTLNAHYTDDQLIRPIWAALADAGIDQGTVLEPGAGRGAFLADAPDEIQVLGVELDPTTARIADALADERHSVVHGDFAAMQFENGAADGVVGNVPFGRYALYDAEHNPRRRLPIHDHFIAKAASTLRPGGIGIVITSMYSLDKQDRAGRDAIGQHADFVGAVRLPDSAHRAEAGTKVVTDVIVLRGRAPEAEPNHAPGWDERPVEITDWRGQQLDKPAHISAYFANNPAHVLGAIQVRNGQFRDELTVIAPDGQDLEQALGATLRRITSQLDPAEPARPGIEAPRDLIRPDQAASLGPIGRIERTETGLFQQLGVDGWEPYKPAGTQRDELAALIGIRDLAEEVVGLEANREVPRQLADDTRSRLRAAYEDYTQRWGPINRVTFKTNGTRNPPKMGGFRHDPGWPRVAALEIYDEITGTAIPASIMEQRLVDDPEVPSAVTEPADALAVSLGQRGEVDIDYLASLLSTEPDTAIDTLGDLIYHDPTGDRWVTAEEYLSGNVRTKYADARTAAEDDPSYVRNVTALGDVIPRDVTAQELVGSLGAPWVPEGIIQDFAQSLCPNRDHRGSITVAHSDETGGWVVNAPSHVSARMMEDHEFGLSGYSALKLLEQSLNGRAPEVKKLNPDGEGRVPDPEATAQATDLGQDLRERFDTWLHEDPERSRRALRIFNDTFNSHVARSYKTAAEALSPEGLRSDFTLRPHQREAVARMVFGGNTLLAHPVGAGKTAEMIVGAMELKRLGVANRPAFVVPNHMLEQIATDIVDLYPGAQVLTATSNNVNEKGRAQFAAKVRSHDWDAVVFTHSSFTAWPLSPESTITGLQAKVATAQADLNRLAEVEGTAAETMTKKVQKRLANYEEALKEQQAQLDNRQDTHTYYFDHSGIDYLLIDEAHEFKSVETKTQVRNLRGVRTGDPSQEAADLENKLGWLRDAYPGRPVATFATATPVSNTAGELWVMGKYLRPDLLTERGVGSFDAFRLAFCDTTSTMELDLTGTSFKRVERLAKYKNLPELSRLWADFADVVNVDDLGIPRPDLAGGKRNVVVVPRSPQLADWMTYELSARADAVRSGGVDPDQDNNLLMTTDARLAAFDWQTFCQSRDRPVGTLDESYSALAAAADQVAAVYHANKDRTYTTATGEEHPRPGAFQLVFSDHGVPDSKRPDTAYGRFRDMLVARGVPRNQVAFAHEHSSSDAAKDRFFAACRDGRVAVAVSSTPKMGQGTNVQDRLLALHHLDCPWRPSDIEQREGRAVRQGNQNPEVQIYAYATEQSYSVSGWQTLERKQGFIGKIMNPDPDGPRTLEPDDEEALSFGQIKAMATGDENFLRLAEAEDQLAGLERLQRGHHQEQAALGRKIANLNDQIRGSRRSLSQLTHWADRIAAHAANSDTFTLWAAGTAQATRGDVARAIAPRLSHRGATEAFKVGVGDTKLSVYWRPFEDKKGEGRFDVSGIPNATTPVASTNGSALVGAITSTINKIAKVPERRDTLENETLPDQLAELERAEAAYGTPFPRENELREARQQVTQLRKTLEDSYAENTPDTSTATAPKTPDIAEQPMTPEAIRADAHAVNVGYHDDPGFQAAVEHGQPVRSITVTYASSRQPSLSDLRVTVRHGLDHDGGLTAADEPEAHQLSLRNARDLTKVVTEKFGLDLPDGVELRINDRTGRSTPNPAHDAARHIQAATRQAHTGRTGQHEHPPAGSDTPRHQPTPAAEIER